MSRLLSITRTGATSLEGSAGRTARATRQRGITSPFKLGPVTLTILTVAFVGLLALFFIMSTTSTSAEGFELHSLEQRADELSEQNEQLEVDLSKLRSLDRLEKSIDESHLNFVPVTKVSSIRISDEALAASSR